MIDHHTLSEKCDAKDHHITIRVIVEHISVLFGSCQTLLKAHFALIDLIVCEFVDKNSTNIFPQALY